MRHHNRYSMTVLAVIGLICSAGNPVLAGSPARLLKDINLNATYDMGSAPQQFRLLTNVTVFWAQTQDTGVELWATDGTEAGTYLVKDLWPGPDSGVQFKSVNEGYFPFDPEILNGVAYFLANDGVHGWELWRSDGTEAGTRMVKEIVLGSRGPFDDLDSSGKATLTWAHTQAGGLIYFAANDGATGFELWRTDGTEAGTFLLKDILPGPLGPFGVHLSRSLSQFITGETGGSLFFSANDVVHGAELWKTDGTSAGTVFLKDIVPGSDGSTPFHMYDLGGALLFWAVIPGVGARPWISDGTPAGTVPIQGLGVYPAPTTGKLYALNGGVVFASGHDLYRLDEQFLIFHKLHAFQGSGFTFHGIFDNRLLFSAFESATGYELWSTDGTPSGTSLLKDIKPGTGSSYPANFVEAGGKIFFKADDGVHGTEPWISDGTEAGTSLLVDLIPGLTSGSVDFREVNGTCYLFAYDGTGTGLWTTDGTAGGTRQLSDALTSASNTGTAPDGALLVGADDRVVGLELWRSDGTPGGTSLVKDINPFIRTDQSFPFFMGAVALPGAGQRMLFSADDGVNGRELWVTDGRAAGTRMVKDINPGPAGSTSSVGCLVHEGVLYFMANDGVHGREIWRSDGTEGGTYLLKDTLPGNPSGLRSPGMFEFRGELYFFAYDSTGKTAIWKTDGTEAGTALAIASDPAQGPLYPSEAFPLGDTLYIGAYTTDIVYTLWKSDGTQAGTTVVRQPVNFEGPEEPMGFVALGNLLFFTASDDYHADEPWISDGTEAGTHILMDIRPGYASSWFAQDPAAAYDGHVYFTGYDGVNGQDLYRTDGTEAGTELFLDERPGTKFSGIGSIAVLDGTLYFTGGSSTSRLSELWKSDGTEQGTELVASDLGGFPLGFDISSGGILFTSWDSDHGYEVWRSDGTEAGTVLAQDLSPGVRNAWPQGYMTMGDRVFFVADDVPSNYEPWVAHAAILLNQPVRAIRDLKGEVQALGLAGGLTTSLTMKLDAAAQSLAQVKLSDTLSQLAAFEKSLQALTPKFVTQDKAAELGEFAGEIEELLQTAP